MHVNGKSSGALHLTKAMLQLTLMNLILAVECAIVPFVGCILSDVGEK